jgi:hypothetical protein
MDDSHRGLAFFPRPLSEGDAELDEWLAPILLGDDEPSGLPPDPKEPPPLPPPPSREADSETKGARS